MAENASDVLIDVLHEWGVEVVFGLPGDGINAIMEAHPASAAATGGKIRRSAGAQHAASRAHRAHRAGRIAFAS